MTEMIGHIAETAGHDEPKTRSVTMGRNPRSRCRNHRSRWSEIRRQQRARHPLPGYTSGSNKQKSKSSGGSSCAAESSPSPTKKREVSLARLPANRFPDGCLFHPQGRKTPTATDGGRRGLLIGLRRSTLRHPQDGQRCICLHPPLLGLDALFVSVRRPLGDMLKGMPLG